MFGSVHMSVHLKGIKGLWKLCHAPLQRDRATLCTINLHCAMFFSVPCKT